VSQSETECTSRVFLISFCLFVIARIRSSSQKYRQNQQDETIRRDVFFHETLPILLPGVEYNYKDEVEKAIIHQDNPLPLRLPMLVEEEAGFVEQGDDNEEETEI
jgi:hypothetical protein